MKISAVVNTLNAEKQIETCLQSLTWADEIVVYDATSIDQTVAIARRFTDRVISHTDTSGFVEPQRNGAIEQATGDWILLVDADEAIPETLAKKLQAVAADLHAHDWYEIPRHNRIFGYWMQATGWWPDYHIRFFKKGAVTWSNEIHVPPQTKGYGGKLDAKPEYALTHHHYDTVSQFIERMNKYTDIQAKQITNQGGEFQWQDLIRKPLSEFLTRYFVWEGYKDGLHGFVLSVLQAISFFVVYLKVWEASKFQTVPAETFLRDLKAERKHVRKELSYWLKKTHGISILGFFRR